MLSFKTMHGQALFVDGSYYYLFNKREILIYNIYQNLSVSIPIVIDATYPSWRRIGITENEILISGHQSQIFEICRNSLKNEHNIIKCKNKPTDSFFSNCFRTRLLCNEKRKYYRKDEHCGIIASVICDQKVNDRVGLTVGKIGSLGTYFSPKPNDPINDVCISMDCLTLAILHQSGYVTVLDLE